MYYCPYCGSEEIEPYDDEYTCLCCGIWWKLTPRPNTGKKYRPNNKKG